MALPRPVVLLAVTVALASPARAQVVRGHVLEHGSDRPIPSAYVALLDAGRHVVDATESGDDGTFRLRWSGEGGFYIYAKAVGYRATLDGLFHADAGDTVSVDFRIPVQAIELDSLEVVGRRSPTLLERVGFMERRQNEAGLFLTREEIEKKPAVRASDALRGHPGIHVVATRGRGTGQTILLRNFCAPRLILDGVEIRAGTAEFDLLLIPEEIQGIEVYRSPAELPIRYSGTGSACGLIVVWTG